MIVDDRDDEVTRRVFANAVAVLGPSWNHRCVRQRGDNDLLASLAFWAGIPEEHVLIYQRDTVLFRQVPDAVLRWAMIGAPCGDLRPDRWTLNGGLSLRQRSAMLDVLACVGRADGEPEDVYFTRGLRLIGHPIPNIIQAAAFSLESDVLSMLHQVGVHGTDKLYMPDELASDVVDEAFHSRAVLV